jgi:acyl-CoA synthetase (NDP forming)
MGFANLVDGVLATTSSLLRSDPSGGDIAVLSQSGGIAFASLGYQARALGLRFSHMVNTGNSVGVSYTDLLAFLFGEERARVVIVAAESETVVAQVLAAVRQHGLRKPMVMLKLGRGETGVRMALSHTGSLAGDYRLIQGLCEQAGIACVDDIDEALGAADLLRNGFTPAHAGGLAAICISGGNVALFADHADRAGVSFAPLTEATEARLRARLPAYISVHNPIDITALGMEEPALYADVLRLAAADETVRVLVPILTSAADCTPMCRMLADLRAETGAPMVTLWTGGSMEDRSPAILREAGIPIFRSSGLLARCLAHLGRAAPAGRQEDSPARALPSLPSGTLTESAAFAFLEAAGIPVPRFRRCTADEVMETAEAVGYPVVVKSDTTETHISDRDGVLLDLRDATALRQAAGRIAAMPGEWRIVAQFLPGLELIVSVFRHAQFGPVLMVGSGGRMVELQSDVRFLGLPTDRAALARALSGTLAGAALQRGHRGAQGFGAAVDLMARVADLGLAAGERLMQIELNPVTVGSHGAAAVDAQVVTRD